MVKLNLVASLFLVTVVSSFPLYNSKVSSSPLIPYNNTNNSYNSNNNNKTPWIFASNNKNDDLSSSSSSANEILKKSKIISQIYKASISNYKSLVNQSSKEKEALDNFEVSIFGNDYVSKQDKHSLKWYIKRVFCNIIFKSIDTMNQQDNKNETPIQFIKRFYFLVDSTPTKTLAYHLPYILTAGFNKALTEGLNIGIMYSKWYIDELFDAVMADEEFQLSAGIGTIMMAINSGIIIGKELQLERDFSYNGDRKMDIQNKNKDNKRPQAIYELAEMVLTVLGPVVTPSIAGTVTMAAVFASTPLVFERHVLNLVVIPQIIDQQVLKSFNNIKGFEIGRLVGTVNGNDNNNKEKYYQNGDLIKGVSRVLYNNNETTSKSSIITNKKEKTFEYGNYVYGTLKSQLIGNFGFAVFEDDVIMINDNSNSQQQQQKEEASLSNNNRNVWKITTISGKTFYLKIVGNRGPIAMLTVEKETTATDGGEFIKQIEHLTNDYHTNNNDNNEIIMNIKDINFERIEKDESDNNMKMKTMVKNINWSFEI